MAPSSPNPRRSVYSAISSDVPAASTASTVSHVADFAPRQRAPRSLPPWIDSYEPRYGPVPKDQIKILYPGRSVPPNHNSTPAETQRRVSQDGFVDLEYAKLGQPMEPKPPFTHFLRYGTAPKGGRKWDHLRSAEPVVVAGYLPTTTQATNGWHGFIQSSAYGPLTNEWSEITDESELEKLQPRFNLPPTHGYDTHATHTSRRKRAVAPYQRVWRLIMRHSLSPFIFRFVVMVTSMLALGIAGEIFRLESSLDSDSAERTQALVAVVVDTVAIPYIGYMIWDEYTGKPLGLRSAVSKISITLLDLFFIIFKSASTALAFESLVYHNVSEDTIRRLAKALAAFMLIGLMSWTMNFTVNIFRTVERLGGREDDHTA